MNKLSGRPKISSPPQAGPDVGQIEAAILASLMDDCPDTLPPSLRDLFSNAPDSFQDATNGAVARTIWNLIQDGRAITLASAHSDLPRAIKDSPLWPAIRSTSPLPIELADVEAQTLVEAFRQRQAKATLTDALDAIEKFPESRDRIVRDTIGTLTTLAGPISTGLPAIVDASTFTASALPHPKELVVGMLHQGSKLVLGGGSKSFKTWVLLDLALSVAYGQKWLGCDTSQGRVLYVNFEIQDYAWQRRIESVAQAKGITLTPGAIDLLNLRGYAADFRTLLPRISTAAKASQYALIVLDPIYKLYGGTDENSAGDVATLCNGLESLTVQAGGGVAFGAHFSKGNQAGKEAIDRISGSGVFARDPDSILIFTKHEEDNAFTIDPILRNFAPVAPFAVRWQFPLMQRDGQLDPARLKNPAGRKPEHNPGELLALLPKNGLTNKNWEKSAKENGISRSTFFRLKHELEKSGRTMLSAINERWLPITPNLKP